MYLITGGAGFIGSNVAGHLAQAGERIIINDTFGSGEKWKNIAKYDIYDFVTPSDLDRWLLQHSSMIKGIVHLGAISATTERDADLIVASNFALSLKLWNWCAANHVAFIYASSAATYGDGAAGFNDDFSREYLARLRPLNPYGWSKLAFDRRVLRAVVDNEPTPPKWAGLKFFNVYGPNEYHKEGMRSVVASNYESLIAGRPLRLFRSYRADYGDGEQKRDFVYVKDCVAVIEWMLNTPFQSGIFNVGSGCASSWLEMGKVIFKAAGLPEKIEFIDMPESLKARYQYFTEAKIEKLRASGFPKAMHSLEAGISDYVKNYLNRDDCFA